LGVRRKYCNVVAINLLAFILENSSEQPIAEEEREDVNDLVKPLFPDSMFVLNVKKYMRDYRYFLVLFLPVARETLQGAIRYKARIASRGLSFMNAHAASSLLVG